LTPGEKYSIIPSNIQITTKGVRMKAKISKRDALFLFAGFFVAAVLSALIIPGFVQNQVQNARIEGEKNLLYYSGIEATLKDPGECTPSAQLRYNPPGVIEGHGAPEVMNKGWYTVSVMLCPDSKITGNKQLLLANTFDFAP